MKTTKLIKRFLPYYKPYVGIMILDLFCASLTTVCELVLPMIVREITDRATNETVKLTVEFVLSIGALYLVLRLIDTAANYYMSTVGHIMGTKIETDMRRDMFEHLQRLSFSFYDNTKVGSIMSRISSDLFDVTEFAHHCPEEFFITGIKIVAAFIILCTINVPLTLIIFAVIPPMILVLRVFNRKMKTGFRESRKQVAELNSNVEDSLLGIRVVQSFANEEIENKKFAKGNNGFLKIKSKVYMYMGGFQSCTRFFDGLMYIVVVGALFIINKQINTADLMAYLLFVSTLLTSIRRIVEFAEQFQRGMTGIERFAEIVDRVPDIKDEAGAVDITDVKGKVEFKDVTFRYSEENEEVLNHINLSINKGENIALVGPSGGGKTTICSLIPRFYDIESGSISVDGVDVRNITLSSLRGNIGIVQQDVYLFSGSVYQNIEYGCPGVAPEQVYEAARLAGADEFIKNLPDGYDTYVGERGVKLSGGQKQRISIARVFLKNPPILILDEATSALDNESEYLVQKSLEKLAKGRTTLTIAHRLTTIKNADRIIVLTKEGIAEQGSHKELLENGGLYSQLYCSYTQI
ncbi:MAG: ABC transporter ATP-binding protein [Ruminococcaceae bacterium]|nr:ABC transporter ATP-binding protein [Oscillospiraceae bacterium]